PTYTAEFQIPDRVHAVVVQSTIPSGRIEKIDTAEARRATGVFAVITPDNAPKLAAPEKRISVLQDNEVHYNNQPIAVVVADTLEHAQYAASLVRVRYQTAAPRLDFKGGFASSYPGTHNGEPGDLSFGDVNAG